MVEAVVVGLYWDELSRLSGILQFLSRIRECENLGSEATVGFGLFGF